MREKIVQKLYQNDCTNIISLILNTPSSLIKSINFKYLPNTGIKRFNDI